MSSIYRGTTEFNKVYLGSNEISSIYNGSVLMFQSVPPTPGTPILFPNCYIGTSIYKEMITTFDNTLIDTAIKNN